MTQAVKDYYARNKDAFLEGLKELLRIPSISALPEHKPDIEKAARFLLDEFKGLGLEARLIEGLGNPLVSAEWQGAPGKPTLLLYGHYDVQPPDPLEEWKSPPFEPEIRGDDIFARGASDDKGQTYIILKAVEGWMKAAGRLPVNVRFLVEGEEESGGEAIETYLKQQGKDIGADAALICDTDMFAPELPTICVGLRGMVYTEVAVQGARSDLHSGMYGGAVPNAVQAAAEIIAGLKDGSGRIQIPGLHDDVAEPSREEKEAWARLPFDEEKYRETEVGSTALTGEPDRMVLERVWSRPALDVHGIKGGFIGEGAKTVIPARATAKVSIRLVPHQDPDKVFAQFEKRVHELAPKGVQVKVRKLYGSAASVADPANPFVKKGAQALENVFGKKAVFSRVGGTIPVVSQLDQYAGIPSVMMGFGLPDDNLHAPNEKFHLPNFYRGIEAVGEYLELLGSE